MLYDVEGNPEIWKSVDNVVKCADAIKSLCLSKGTGEIPSEVKPQIDSALKNLAIFVREEAAALKRTVKPATKQKK